ncbi:MAG: rhodanese-like domain-containing protein [Phycisphaeraceae bacterium]|nr:MAG: rhodanese-like domain-containing protein [Phycisphaeraceae bacterium]
MTTQAISGTSHTSAGAGSGTAKEVSPAQVKSWLGQGQCVLIDVREPDEHARERIAGAALLPLSRFDPTQAAALAKPGLPVVLHCRSGRRSADACRMASSLSSRGLAVLSLSGGIDAWKAAGLPVEVDTRVARMSVMRQVQLVIGLFVLAGSALAWFVDPGFIAVPAFFGAGLAFAGATGTCALATLIGRLPWNRSSGPGASCAAGTCG